MATLAEIMQQRRLENLGFNAGGQANFSGINPQQIYQQFQADQAISPDRGGSEDAYAQPVQNFGSGGQGLDHWGYGGYGVIPMGNGMYGIARGSAAPNGTGYGIHPNVPMDVYDASGKFLGTGQTPAGLNPNDDSMKQFLIGAAMMAGPFAAAIGGAGAAAGAAGGVGGAGGTGAGLAEGAGMGGGYGASLTGGIGSTVPAGAGFAGSGALDAAGIGGAGYGSAFGMGAGNLALDGAAAAGAGGALGAAGGAGGGGGAGGVTPQAMGSAGGTGVPPNPYVSGGGGMSSIFGGGSGDFNWSSLLGPAASLGGSFISAGASKDAANAQQQAVDKAIALNEPFRVAGVNATNRLQQLLGIGSNPNAPDYGSEAKNFGMSDFQQDPGYQFRLQQGQQQLQRQLSANGSLYSGKALKDMQDYTQGQASQEFGNAYNRYQTNRAAILNPLQAMAGQGQSAANTTGNYVTQGGNAQAAGIVGSANAINSGLTGAYGAYQQNQLLNMLMQNQARTSPGIYGY